MKHQTRNIHSHFAVVLALSALTFAGGAMTIHAQEKNETKPARTRANQAGRDPFSKYVPPRAPVKSNGIVAPPSIQERISQYKAQKQSAMQARVVAPKPTTAFLLNEMQVVGISRTPRGYAAIVEASPIKLSYVIYPGERFYDGQLVAIEDSRLVFRREVVYTDGRRERTVEMKPLRQANVAEAMSAARSTTPTTAPVESAEKSSAPKTPGDKP